MSEQSTTCETCARLGQTPDADHMERVLTLRTIPADVQTTHWEDSDGLMGCWALHQACAVAMVERLRDERDDAIRCAVRERDDLHARLAASEQRAAALVEGMEAFEWLPERNMKGTMTDFCTVCGGTPSMYELNKTTTRPDGHRLQTLRFPNGCPLAKALDMARAALAAAPSDCQKCRHAPHNDHDCVRCTCDLNSLIAAPSAASTDGVGR